MEFKPKAQTPPRLTVPTPFSLSVPLQYSPNNSSSSSPTLNSSQLSSPASSFPSPSPPTSQSSPTSTTNVNPTPPPPPPPPPAIVMSPCAACKILRRRCVDKCVLAPYFPPTEPLKFTIAHRVFGASNIIKFLQRTDAVSSMVYEANARIRDPVYGCAGAICQLQKQVSELQGQLAKAQAELVNMQCQQANLIALICMDVTQLQDPNSQQQPPYVDTSCFLDDNTLGTTWEPLWT
ncbi:LOB domain-containing protein 1-like isoform X2 [Humulus lupulus]|uniref:LOB domain-containing protein 1-like isoform X2 n=1 Tax=Humulus lupulus TaxID=3486 RepID=UPI002B404ABD|nr:LOB domain-containing protein 1-like isoform X2 [Humulus lupulus]